MTRYNAVFHMDNKLEFTLYDAIPAEVNQVFREAWRGDGVINSSEVGVIVARKVVAIMFEEYNG